MLKDCVRMIFKRGYGGVQNRRHYRLQEVQGKTKAASKLVRVEGGEHFQSKGTGEYPIP